MSEPNHPLERSKLLVGGLLAFSSAAVFGLVTGQSQSGALNFALWGFTVALPCFAWLLFDLLREDHGTNPSARRVVNFAGWLGAAGFFVGMSALFAHASWAKCVVFVVLSLAFVNAVGLLYRPIRKR